MIGFIIWAVVGVLFIGFGIAAFLAKEATGFWANAKMFEVNDVKKYNYAMGKLWCIFGAVFIVLGIPLLEGQNSPWGILTIAGVFSEVIAVMIIYTQVIEKKYRKK